MTEPKDKTRASSRAARSGSTRSYDADTQALRSLKLIAAPNPKDDLSDEELAAFCQDPKNSTDLVRHLIEFVKTL
jgi:hypothetical protein